MLDSILRDKWLSEPFNGEPSFWDEIDYVAGKDDWLNQHDDVMNAYLEVYLRVAETFSWEKAFDPELVASGWEPTEEETRLAFASMLRRSIKNERTFLIRKHNTGKAQDERAYLSFDKEKSPLGGDGEDAGTLHDIIEAPLRGLIEDTNVRGGADLDKLLSIVSPELSEPLAYYIEHVVALGRSKLEVYEEMREKFGIHRRHFMRKLMSDSGFKRFMSDYDFNPEEMFGKVEAVAA